MSPEDVRIDPDITRARTLPAEVYSDPAWFDRQCRWLFPRTWQVRPPAEGPPGPGAIRPWTLLPGALDEPLLLTGGEDGSVHCLSNVCTHRGKLLVDRPCEGRGIRCGYHGRRFALDGRLVRAPGFDGAADFPGESDHLPRIPARTFAGLVFASLDPAHPLDILLDPVRRRLEGLPVERLQLAPERGRTYDVAANWALYCDNYLEGLHIPYVHPSLARALDVGAYRTELLPHGVLQIGMAAPGETALDLPPGHPDHGERIAGYYFWLFPTTMLNVYPWGISLNVVLPRGPQRTQVVFASLVWDQAACGTGAGASLDQVEFEDEVVVESVARGVRSRLYRRGRYAPAHERGVHHFHRLLVDALRDAPTSAIMGT